MTENKKLLLELMVENEEVVGKLYKKYSDMFENSDFWEELSSEEFIHSQWLRSLALGENPVYIDVSERNPQALQTMIEANKERLGEGHQPDIIEALSIAKSAEDALIEGECFKIFESDAPEVKRILEDLERETKDHQERVEDELRKYKIRLNVV